MKAINGWSFERDELGFWAVSGSVRVGPFETPAPARAHARTTPPPEKPKRPQRTTPAEPANNLVS